MNPFNPIKTFIPKYPKNAPWDNQSFEHFPELDGEINKNSLCTIDNLDEDDEKTIKRKLNRLTLTSVILTIIGSILFIVLGIASESEEGSSIERFFYFISDALGLHDSFGYLLLIMIVPVAFIVLFISYKIDKKRNTIFKQWFIQSRLQKYFNISDYIYNEIDAGKAEIFNFLNSLNILNNTWISFKYNDYFRGTYQNTPFLFFDCVLSGRQDCDVEHFKGQIILIHLREISDDYSLGVRTYIEKPEDNHVLPSFGEIHEHQMLDDHVEPLFSKRLTDFPEIKININRKKLSHKDNNTQNGLDELSLPPDVVNLLNSQESVFRSVYEIAQCDTGIVLSGKYLAIILANNYDPFEFKSREMFKSYPKLKAQVDMQVNWLCSIFKELEKTGWL